MGIAAADILPLPYKNAKNDIADDDLSFMGSQPVFPPQEDEMKYDNLDDSAAGRKVTGYLKADDSTVPHE